MPNLRLDLSVMLNEALEKYTEQVDGKSKRAVALRILAEWLADELGDATLTAEAPTPGKAWGGWRGSPESLKALAEYADRRSNFGHDDPTEVPD